MWETSFFEDGVRNPSAVPLFVDSSGVKTDNVNPVIAFDRAGPEINVYRDSNSDVSFNNISLKFSEDGEVWYTARRINSQRISSGASDDKGVADPRDIGTYDFFRAGFKARFIKVEGGGSDFRLDGVGVFPEAAGRTQLIADKLFLNNVLPSETTVANSAATSAVGDGFANVGNGQKVTYGATGKAVPSVVEVSRSEVVDYTKRVDVRITDPNTTGKDELIIDGSQNESALIGGLDRYEIGIEDINLDGTVSTYAGQDIEFEVKITKTSSSTTTEGSGLITSTIENGSSRIEVYDLSGLTVQSGDAWALTAGSEDSDRIATATATDELATTIDALVLANANNANFTLTKESDSSIRIKRAGTNTLDIEFEVKITKTSSSTTTEGSGLITSTVESGSSRIEVYDLSKLTVQIGDEWALTAGSGDSNEIATAIATDELSTTIDALVLANANNANFTLTKESSTSIRIERVRNPAKSYFGGETVYRLKDPAEQGLVGEGVITAVLNPSPETFEKESLYYQGGERVYDLFKVSGSCSL